MSNSNNRHDTFNKIDEELQISESERSVSAQALKRQNLRVKKRQAADAAVKNKTAVGSQAFQASDLGYDSSKNLPTHFKELINNWRKYVYSKRFSPMAGVSQTLSPKTLKNVFEIGVTMMTTCDLTSGKVGKASMTAWIRPVMMR